MQSTYHKINCSMYMQYTCLIKCLSFQVTRNRCLPSLFAATVRHLRYRTIRVDSAKFVVISEAYVFLIRNFSNYYWILITLDRKRRSINPINSDKFLLPPITLSYNCFSIVLYHRFLYSLP